MEDRREAYRKLACACNELAVVDFVFYLNNPCHYNDEQSWQVMSHEKAPSRHTAMANCAVSSHFISDCCNTMNNCWTQEDSEY